MNTIPSGCIPFDLDKYKAGHPARFRDGSLAKFVAHSPDHPDKYCSVMSLMSNGTWRSTSVSGKYRSFGDSDYDLFLVAPEPKWMPWTSLSEVPLDHWYRENGSPVVRRVIDANPMSPTLQLSDDRRVFLVDLFETYEHAADPFNGPWLPCGKEEVK